MDFAVRSHKNMPAVEEVSDIATGKQKKAEVDRLSSVQKLAAYLDDQENYMEVDMGQIDEEERPFMIVDKDTGRIYDVRNDAQVERLTGLATTKIGN